MPPDPDIASVPIGAGGVLPLQVVKLKINGRCMNSCWFCTFHSRSERIELPAVRRILGLLPPDWRGQLLVNGGEPTLHPGFLSIVDELARYRPACRVGLGTNLRLFEAGRRAIPKVRRIWEAIVTGFDLLQVGCDDVHRNLDVVEALVPEIRALGIDVFINCIEEAASPETQSRLRDLDERTGSRTRFSALTPRGPGSARPAGKELPLCRKRRREVLIDCDGGLFFCFNQELERPIGNIHQLEDDILRGLLLDAVPASPFRACGTCVHHSPESSA